MTVVKGVSKMKLMGLLPLIYNGTILGNDGIRHFEYQWLELQTNNKVFVETDDFF